MDIDVKVLTTYKVSEDGEKVALRLVDETGTERCLNFKVSQLGNLVVTLPSLIEAALRQQYRDAAFRFAYPVGSWSVEEAVDPGALIVTLRTLDGFGVSFSLGRGNAERLGHSMAGVSRPVAATTH
ncbi:hypothetical protein [Hyphomicrobium sp.]|uniref:hypothetical protein n=1 Tax=Hyphomicrobium sp. TaxID=82 RepID=UPI0025BB9445|nr:hypothetical protein [Hyphomicrobium sp.]MCC7254036.1 hypothetical protein [Hyphomicrobium sp.]